MGVGYPILFPTGFVTHSKDSCEGPILYRSQPSRETPGIVELNSVINKYGQGQYKGGDFMRLVNNLKNTTRMWERLPREAKSDFLKLIIDSDSKLSNDIIQKYISKNEAKKVRFSDKVEYFGESDSETGGVEKIVETKTDNKMSILIIVIVAIVAIVIGFLIACTSRM